jgi:hypothetical protein
MRGSTERIRAMSDQTKSPRLADDLLIGAKLIGEYIGTKNTGQIYYLAKTGQWPIGRIGKTLIASKRQLDRRADKLTSGT